MATEKIVNVTATWMMSRHDPPQSLHLFSLIECFRGRHRGGGGAILLLFLCGSPAPFFHAAKWAFSTLKLAPPWRQPPQAPVDSHRKWRWDFAPTFAQRTPWGGGKKRGVENLTNVTPPKRGFWTPPRTVRSPPPSGVSALFSCTKHPRENRREAFLEGSKIFGRARSLVCFPPPIRFAPPHITAQFAVSDSSCHLRSLVGVGNHLRRGGVNGTFPEWVSSHERDGLFWVSDGRFLAIVGRTRRSLPWACGQPFFFRFSWCEIH